MTLKNQNNPSKSIKEHEFDDYIREKILHNKLDWVDEILLKFVDIKRFKIPNKTTTNPSLTFLIKK